MQQLNSTITLSPSHPLNGTSRVDERGVIIYDVEQRSAEWFALRAGKVTGSGFEKVLNRLKNGNEGADRRNYRTQLVCERLTGQPCEDQYQTAAMRWGKEQEPMARISYIATTGADVEEIGFAQHPTLMVGISPDGFVNRDGVHEIKCPQQPAHLKILQTRELPEEYKPQVQGQLWVSCREWADFTSYNPLFPKGMDEVTIRIYRDEEYIQMLEREVIQFLGEVDAEIAALTGSAISTGSAGVPPALSAPTVLPILESVKPEEKATPVESLSALVPLCEPLPVTIPPPAVEIVSESPFLVSDISREILVETASVPLPVSSVETQDPPSHDQPFAASSTPPEAPPIPVESPSRQEPSTAPPLSAFVPLCEPAPPPPARTITIAEFIGFESALTQLENKFRAAAFAVDTAEGMKQAKEARSQIKSSRCAVANMKKLIKEKPLKLCQLIDAEANLLTTGHEAIENPIAKQIDDQEKLEAEAKAEALRIEAERIKAEEARIKAEQAALERDRAEVDRREAAVTAAETDPLPPSAGKRKIVSARTEQRMLEQALTAAGNDPLLRGFVTALVAYRAADEQTVDAKFSQCVRLYKDALQLSSLIGPPNAV